MPKPERYPVVVVDHPDWLSGAVPALPSLCYLWNLPWLPEPMENLWSALSAPPAPQRPSRRPQVSHSLLGKPLRAFPQPLGKPADGRPSAGFPAPTGSTTTKKPSSTKGGNKLHFHQEHDYDPVETGARLRRPPDPTGSHSLSKTLQPGHEPPDCWSPHGYPLCLYLMDMAWRSRRFSGVRLAQRARAPARSPQSRWVHGQVLGYLNLPFEIKGMHRREG